MKHRGKGSLPNIFFVVQAGKNRLLLSESAIYSKKEVKVIDAKSIVNDTGTSLKAGDKIVANLRPTDQALSFTLKRIIARKQPMAISDKQYLRSLRIYVIDVNKKFDCDEVNGVLERILGITVEKAKETPRDYHLVINCRDEDPGTRHCPFIFRQLPTSYPLKIDFPRVSEATKKYLRMVYPDGEITDSRIFAFRLVHFLLHRLGYLDHLNHQKMEEHEKSRKALREGGPSQIPVLDMANVCPCDWELMHFLAVRPDVTYRFFEKMLCKDCGRKRIPVGIGPKDFETIFLDLTKNSEPNRYPKTEKHIFYVVETRDDGLVLNESPYKSKITANVMENDWHEILIETYENLPNIFVPTELLDRGVEMKRGEKVLMQVETETTPKKDKFGFMTKARHFKVEAVLRKGVKIINPSSLLSRIRPFRLNVSLKIGPETDLELVKSVSEIISNLTGWHVEIDKSSYEDLSRSFHELAEVHKEWESRKGSDRSGLVARARGIVDQLAPKVHEVEDRFNIPVFVFPEKFTFIEDILGNIAFGKAVNRIYAVVSIFPSTPPAYEAQEPCKSCIYQFTNAFREEITSLFVVHEVLHIASGLNDHRECSLCFYGRREMQPFRRYHCEECIRKGNDQTQKNCLMSYACIPCLSMRLSGSTFSQFLCQKCKRKLLPDDQFAARQAARLNSLIYYRHLVD